MGNKNSKINGLAHIGVFVSDIDRSIAYYTSILDFEYDHRFDIENNGEVTKIAFVKKGTCVIELVQQPEAKQKLDGSIDHIALDVDDIEAVMAGLIAKGVVFETDKPLILPKKLKYAFFRGLNGERFEINQRL